MVRKRQAKLAEVPARAKEFYGLFLGAIPESQHDSATLWFYCFVGALLYRSRNDPSPDWVAQRLRHDRPQMSPEDIDWYVMAYCHIKDYERRGDNQLFKLYGSAKHSERMAKLVEAANAQCGPKA